MNVAIAVASVAPLRVTATGWLDCRCVVVCPVAGAAACLSIAAIMGAGILVVAAIAGPRITMSAVIIEHDNVSDLPEAWRARLPAPQTGASGEDILSGMWRDREDMADVEAWLRKIRAPRYHLDGSRNQG